MGPNWLIVYLVRHVGFETCHFKINRKLSYMNIYIYIYIYIFIYIYIYIYIYTLKKTCNFYGQIPAILMPVVDHNSYG